MSLHRTLTSFGSLLFVLSCNGGEDGRDGRDGDDGTSCTVEDNGDGTATLTCEDGETYTIENGQDGMSCTVTGNVIECDDGTTYTIEDGDDGDDGLDSGQTRGLEVAVDVGDPPNGTHFVTGERIPITVTLTDASDAPLLLADLSAAHLFIYGPRGTTTASSAISLMATTADRSVSTHHRVDLKTFTGSNLVVNGNELVFTTAAIGSEAAGTYTVALHATSAAYEADRVFELETVQIGTATISPLTQVTCDGCHLGEDNGQLYLHHVDPGRSPYGSPEYEWGAVQSCYACHNEDGYAAVRECDDGSVPTDDGTGTLRCEDDSTNWSYTSDAAVRRVHGVHRGGDLGATFSIADFADYLDVEFPADLRNCTTCHTDDAWKTRPSRRACGSCHDTVDFTTGTNHGDGGIQLTDENCTLCHTATEPGVRPITEYHAIPENLPEFTVEMAMSAPTNTEFYVSESPTLSITLKRGADVVDPTGVTEAAFYRARLLVSGPRAHTKPVLSTVAATNSTLTYWYDDIRLRTNSSNNDPAVTRSTTEWTYQLSSTTGLQPGTYTAFVVFVETNGDLPSVGSVHFQIGTDEPEPFTATNCTDCHGDTRVKAHDEAYDYDVDVCKSCHDYKANTDRTYTGWDDGHYGFKVEPLARRVHRVHFGHYLAEPEEEFETFIFPQDVRNCTKCHGEDTRYLDAPTRIGCTACHDTEATYAHALLNTVDPTPAAPFSGDEVESCSVCHGPGSVVAADVVHNITEPYEPPYPREP